MKKLFAMFAVCALAAVGCDDKNKSTGGAKTNTTLVTTKTEKVETQTNVTHTVVENKVIEKDTKVNVATTTVQGKTTGPDKGPTPPGGDKGK